MPKAGDFPVFISHVIICILMFQSILSLPAHSSLSPRITSALSVSSGDSLPGIKSGYVCLASVSLHAAQPLPHILQMQCKKWETWDKCHDGWKDHLNKKSLKQPFSKTWYCFKIKQVENSPRISTLLVFQLLLINIYRLERYKLGNNFEYKHGVVTGFESSKSGGSSHQAGRSGKTVLPNLPSFLGVR